MRQIAFVLIITVAGVLLATSPAVSGQEHEPGEWRGRLVDEATSFKELPKILEEHSRWLESDGKEGQRANLRGVNLREAPLYKANLSGADLRKADLSQAVLGAADLHDAVLTDANLREANLWKANLAEAELVGADLSAAKLVEADLRKANLSGTKFHKTRADYADFSNSLFEPENIKKMQFLGAKGLSTIEFTDPTAAVALLKIAKESRLRNEERALTAALRKYRLKGAQLHERVFEYIILDFPTDSGANPWRSLELLGLVILAFSIPYMVSLLEPGNALLSKLGLHRKPSKDGIWKVWITDRVRKDLGEENPIRITLRGWPVLRVGIYFSILSAFHIGWRELNLGNWIARIQPREYSLRASGWVRTVSGIQSLISVYLVVLWLLTYFGRPFE